MVRAAYRALGRGCLQLQNPMHQAAYLLGPDAARAALPTEGQCEAAPKPRSFFLKQPVPLHVRYATCAVVAGRLRFYADVYGRDEALRQQLFGRGQALGVWSRRMVGGVLGNYTRVISPFGTNEFGGRQSF